MQANNNNQFEVTNFETSLRDRFRNIAPIAVDLAAIDPAEQFKFILHYHLRASVIALLQMGQQQLLALTITRGSVTRTLAEFVQDGPLMYVDHLHVMGTVPGTDADPIPMMGRQLGLIAYAHGLQNKGVRISIDDSDRLAAVSILTWLALDADQRQLVKNSYFEYIESDNVAKHARKRDFIAQPLRHWIAASRFYQSLGIHQQWVDALTRNNSKVIGSLEPVLRENNQTFSPATDPMGNGYDQWLSTHKHLEPALATIMGVMSRVKGAPEMENMRFLGRDNNMVHFRLGQTLSARIIDKIGEAIDTLEIFNLNP